MVDMPKIVTLFAFKSHKSILCGERHEAANMEIRGYIYILPQWNSHRSGDSTVYTLNLSRTIPVKWPNLKWLRPTSIKNSSMDMNFNYNTSIIQLCFLVKSPFLMFKSPFLMFSKITMSNTPCPVAQKGFRTSPLSKCGTLANNVGRTGLRQQTWRCRSNHKDQGIYVWGKEI